MKKIYGAVIMSIAAVASPSIAGEAAGKVKSIRARADDGLHWVILDSPSVSSPPCSTHGYFMIRDEKSDTGKSQFAMLMSAYMSGKRVIVSGTGTCTRWGDGEDISTVTLAD